MTTLSQKTLIGIIWNMAEQFFVRGITVIVTLLLAYFLSPEDFGLLAMIAVFISIASSLMDSGFRQALIRLPDASQVDFNTAFYANILLGHVSYLILFSTAPSIAFFYEEESLTNLIRVAGLVVIVNSFQVVQYAKLSRALNFKVQFRAALPASIISSVVAITMAYLGFGVWALITQMLISAFLVALFLWCQMIWRPTLSWSSNSLKSMYQFGYKLFLSGLIDTGFKNMYVVVIAKLFTTNFAGLYFFADRIRELVIYQIVSAVQKVTYPALATIQDKPTKLKQGYKKVIAMIAFILFPLILFLAALAEPIFHLLLPEEWWPAALYMQLMCLAGVLIPVHAINLNILKVLGRSDLFLWLEIIKKSIAVMILLISFRFGIVGILIGQIVSSVLAYLPNSYYSKRLIDYPVSEQLTDFLPCLLLAGNIGIAVWGLQTALPWPELIKLIVLAVLAFSAYVTGAWLLRLHGLELARGMIVNRLKGKVA